MLSKPYAARSYLIHDKITTGKLASNPYAQLANPLAHVTLKPMIVQTCLCSAQTRAAHKSLGMTPDQVT